MIIFLSSFHYLTSVPHIIPINSNNNIKLLLIIVTYFNDFVRLSPNNHQQKASVLLLFNVCIYLKGLGSGASSLGTELEWERDQKMRLLLLFSSVV